MKKKILVSNGTSKAYTQQDVEVLPDASIATLGQIATVTAGGTVAFLDPFLKSGGTIGGALIATSFKLPNASVTNIWDNGSDDSYMNIRVIQNRSALNQDGLFIGYANNGSSQTRIFDGGSSNYVGIGSATFSTGGITKFLFGNQADNGTFAQFSGAVHAKSTLKVDGAFSFGSLGTRTETITDAGIVAYSKSGFYDAFNATNFPINDGSWWHLINAQHYNSYAGNNYAMQIAGSFFDQRIFFRKTNTSATQTWREFVTSDSAGNVTINGVLNLSGANFAYWDGTWNRIYKRNTNPAFSIGNIQTYFDNDTHFFRTVATVTVAQIDIDGVYTPYKFRGAKMMLGSAVDNGNILQVTGDSYFVGNVRATDNIVLNTNNRFLYCTDAGGSNRRYLGLSGVNFYMGDIDNTVANSANYFLAQNAHLFINNGVESARIIQNGSFGIKTNAPQYTLDVNGSFGLRGAFTSPIRAIGGSTGTYAISATDHVVIITTSPGSTFTVDAPTTANTGREIILVNKSIATQTLSQNYINLSGSTTNQFPNNTSIRLKYDGTNIQQI